MAITLSLDDLDKKRKEKRIDNLAIFLFLLLRDHLTFGELESILSEVENGASLIPTDDERFLVAYLAKVRERILR